MLGCDMSRKGYGMRNDCSDGFAMADERERAFDLAQFIENCPSMFHTTAEISRRLRDAGFSYLPEGDAWNVQRGGSYFTTRNGSTVIAFKIGSELDSYHFQITAAHGDSPTFKVKANAELSGPGEYTRLNTEVYGGAIDYTWFDKPLSVAGRALVSDWGRIESRLFCIDKEVALIPSLAIHMNRGVNDKFSPNRQVDLMPLFSAGVAEKGEFDAMIASAVGVEPSNLIARDAFLVNMQKPKVWGIHDEFLSSPKLDDLACAYVSLEAFLASRNERDVSVYCCFDNEEVGSNTKQGAMSTVLSDTLTRINVALGFSQEDYHRAVAKSMLVSCDNAHAKHPNHPEVADSGNYPVLNGGIVVKEAANQKYCTDAFSRALFLAVCGSAGAPVQTFANRSDMAGGSTLGNLSNTQVSLHGVDVGLPQLAMHSSYETCGVRDISSSIVALKAFFNANIRITESSFATFE